MEVEPQDTIKKTSEKQQVPKRPFTKIHCKAPTWVSSTKLRGFNFKFDSEQLSRRLRLTPRISLLPMHY